MKKSKKIASSDYERIWSRRLHHEFQVICRKYGIRLDAPVFMISRSKVRLGNWQPRTRTIGISSYVIKNFPWDITLQVLKHEIAHQICSELFNDRQGGHGENFHKASETIGLEKNFRLARLNLSRNSLVHERPAALDDPTRKILERIRKLLALGESSNKHESALAFEMARELTMKHKLENLCSEGEEEITYLIINTKKRRLSTYQRLIVAILTRYFFVKIVCSETYDPVADETYKTFEIFGKKSNVEIAEHCYRFLDYHIDFLWRQEKAKYKKERMNVKRSFYLGVFEGLNERLKNLRKIEPRRSQHHPSTRFRSMDALMRKEDEALDKYISARHPKLSRKSIPNMKIDIKTFEDGISVGGRIVIPTGIRQDDALPKRLTR